MGFFSRNKDGDSQSAGGRIIDPGLLAKLPEIGRLAYGRTPHYVEVSDFYLPGFQAAGFPTDGAAWNSFVARFTSELVAGSATGGWASVGAFHVAKDFVKSEDWSKSELVSLMDAALRVLIQEGSDSSVVPFFALTRFNELRGGQ